LEGATRAPVICSEVERERAKSLERMSVFAGKALHRFSSFLPIEESGIDA